MAVNGNIIKQLRKEAGFTQVELGEKLGVIKQTISSWENNVSEPNSETLTAISKLFGVSVDYLLGNNSDSNTSVSNNSVGGYDNSINHWIARTGLSNDEVAKKLGISESLLVDYIQLKIHIPYQILSALSDICEVSTDCLLGLNNSSRNKDFDNVLPFRYNYEIAKRIRKLCNDHNIDTESSYLENLLCLSKKEIFYLIEYGFVPHIDIIIKLANEFHVSCDYLLCRVDNKTENAISSFNRLNEDNQDIIIGKTKELLREQRLEESAVAAVDSKKVVGK